MRVVIPNKLKEKISEALTELYLFRQAVESGLVKDSKKIIKRIEKIKKILKDT
jgi:hypothetical protein|tara:strand:+ start:4700 stop:4858 length:159 start_codon:yes stop_codon:yes gene_type:complete